MKKLTQQEINRRMIQWRNDRRLEPQRKRRMRELEERCARLEGELARERRERQEIVEILMLQIEELQKMVFGKKRRDRGDDDDQPGKGSSGATLPPNKTSRSSASYRRPIPLDEAVTEETFHGIDQCAACHEPLVHLKEAVRFLEDIVLPSAEKNPLKTVVKQHIETGFCKRCRKWRSAIPIEKQVCSLGQNVHQRMVYAVTVLGMTFEKVLCDLRDTFDITVSDGEMANILTREAAKLLPEYHSIDGRIRSSPCVHLDETGWPVQKEGEGQFGWVKTASDAPDTIFRLGRSRGKGNAKALVHDFDQPMVTDDYSAYNGFSKSHGLCWAHPKRKFRDLAESPSLPEERRQHCQQFYKRFCTFMTEVKRIVESPYDRDLRSKAADRCSLVIAQLMLPQPQDPKKLATLKKTFLNNTEQYLLCLREPHIPMTNNKAERSVRPLVIKRKLSFGSKTQKGADVMSILMSVCFTTWWSRPKNFFPAYSALLQKWQTA